MKAILTGIIVAVVIATGVGFLLPLEPELTWQAHSPPSIRVGEPGSNLVGPEWTGLNRVETGNGDHPG
jgi:hypothetical protein